MAERPRSRQTIIVGWVTCAVMVLIATVILLIQSPWNDRVPGTHKKVQQHHSISPSPR